MDYTLHNADGKVLAIVGAKQDELPFYIEAYGAAGAIPGSWHWDKFRISDGEAVPLPPSPGVGFEWSWSSMEWVQTRTIAQARREKRQQIDAWRLAANRAGFVYQGRLVATDELSMIDISNTNGEITRTGSMPANWPGGWKAEGQIIPISTIEQWSDFFSAMFQQGLANFNKSQALKLMVDDAQSIDEVDEINWESL